MTCDPYWLCNGLLIGGCVIHPTTSVCFISLVCPCLYSSAKQSASSMNLSPVCWWLVFDISFLRHSSSVIGLTFICLLILMIVHLCIFYHCHHQICVPLLYHESRVLKLWVIHLQLILWEEKKYFCGYLHLHMPGLSVYKGNMVIFIIIT